MRGRLALVAGGALLLAGCVGAPDPGNCVQGLSITSDHDAHTVALTWEPVAGAEFYQVNRSIDEGAETVQALFAAEEGPAYNETDVPPGIVTYRVAADGHPSGCDGVSVHFGGEPEPPPVVVCVADLQALAAADGTVILTWTAVENATSYDVLRAEGEGQLAPFAFVPAGVETFADLTTVPGVTYRYAVAANGLPLPEEPCPEVEVTAIPFFDSPLAFAAAGLATLGACALVARRR